MKEVTFFRLFFMGILVLFIVVWSFFYPLIEPYPTIEYIPPVIPELPNPRDPRTWEEWLPEFYIDPMYIYIGILFGIVVIIIAIVAYYRREVEE
ncbi:MAG: hypothetical protein HWN67_22450 [Candidatus Helarchaeota archaeon]|nr:hypothetical protein [Candidatus Helarchaeota archaeon]